MATTAPVLYRALSRRNGRTAASPLQNLVQQPSSHELLGVDRHVHLPIVPERPFALVSGRVFVGRATSHSNSETACYCSSVCYSERKRAQTVFAPTPTASLELLSSSPPPPQTWLPTRETPRGSIGVTHMPNSVEPLKRATDAIALAEKKLSASKREIS